MATPETNFKMEAPVDMTLGEALASQPTKKVEVIGNPNPTSLENALGIEGAKGHVAPPRTNPDRKKVFEGESKGEGQSSEMVEILRELRQENVDLRSERGKYGREVVGPLRKENEDMYARLQALETKMQSGAAPAAPDPAAYARQVFGPDVDVDDPEVIRQTRSALSVLDAAERGTMAMMNPVMRKLESLEAALTGTRELAATGLTLDQVQKAEEGYPELKDLPEAKRYALIRRLSQAGREQTPGRNAQGHFANDAARATARPEQFVEGGSGSTGQSPMDQATGSERWQTRLERFQDIGQTGKAGGGERQKNLFLDMLQRGDFQ